MVVWAWEGGVRPGKGWEERREKSLGRFSGDGGRGRGGAEGEHVKEMRKMPEKQEENQGQELHRNQVQKNGAVRYGKCFLEVK